MRVFSRNKWVKTKVRRDLQRNLRKQTTTTHGIKKTHSNAGINQTHSNAEINRTHRHTQGRMPSAHAKFHWWILQRSEAGSREHCRSSRRLLEPYEAAAGNVWTTTLFAKRTTHECTFCGLEWTSSHQRTCGLEWTSSLWPRVNQQPVA
jgi:hypothetical protein